MILEFNGWSINTIDDKNYTLNKVSKAKSDGITRKDGTQVQAGDVVERVEGYYPRLYMACQSLLERKLNESDAKTVEELKNVCAEAYAGIRAMCDGR